MQLEYQCADCGAEITIDFALTGKNKITAWVQTCSHCVARKAMLAMDNEWVRKKTEREAAA